MRRVAIIGAGVVGTAMGYLLKNAGYSVAGIAGKTLRSAQRAREFIGAGEASTDLKAIARKADIVFITTSDDAIGKVCMRMASEGAFNPDSIVFHTCGALSSEILSPARDVGAYVASFHPLQSLASVNKAVKNLVGSYFCIEGDAIALATARKIIAVLKGKEIELNVDKKPLYHAGASVASNFLVATVGFGLELFEASGINRQVALKALMPLIKGTVKNVENLGIPSALTGPISRGDTGVVEDHLRVISKQRPELLRLYAELGRQTVNLALEKGTLKKLNAEKIISLFDKYIERNN